MKHTLRLTRSALAAASLAACCLLNCWSPPPTPVISGPDSGLVRAPVRFRVYDPGGVPTIYSPYWSWGDSGGTSYYAPYGVHAYASAGTYTVTCVTMSHGSEPAPMLFSEPSAPRTIRIVPYTLAHPDSVVDTVPTGSRVNDWVCILPDGSRLYVTNAVGDSVSVIDAATNSVAANIAVPDSPTCCVASNSGRYVYVSCLAAESVAVIDVAEDSVIRTIPIDGKPGRLAVLPNDSLLYVAHTDRAFVSVVSTSDWSVLTRVAVAGPPNGIAVKPGGGYVCVASEGCNAVTLIRTSDNTLALMNIVNGAPTDAEFSPSGDTVYVCCPGDNNMKLLRSIDLSMIEAVCYDSLGFSNPRHPVLLPGGECLYITATLGHSAGPFVVRRSDNYLLRIAGIGFSRTAVPSSDGSKVYVPTKQGVVVLGLRPGR